MYRSDLTTDMVNCGLKAKKQFEIGSPDCWLKFLTSLSYDTKSQEVPLWPYSLLSSLYIETDQDIKMFNLVPCRSHSPGPQNMLFLQLAGLGCVQLTKSIYNFTDTQDIRMRIGYEAFVDQRGNVTGVQFLSSPALVCISCWSFVTKNDSMCRSPLDS